jgi:hypothetical protein
VGPSFEDKQKFALVVVMAVDVALLEFAVIGLEVVGWGALLLVFSYFFSVVEMVDFPLG